MKCSTPSPGVSQNTHPLSIAALPKNSPEDIWKTDLQESRSYYKDTRLPCIQVAGHTKVNLVGSQGSLGYLFLLFSFRVAACDMVHRSLNARGSPEN